MNEQNLSVGQVAKRSGVKVSALHYYEDVGLIKSWRNQGNQRRFKKDVLRRISVIKAAQKVGVSLSSIKEAFKALPNSRTPTAKDWEKLAAKWKRELEARIQYLENLRDSLTGCIGCGCLSMKNCPLYNPEDQLGTEGTGPILLDNKVKL